MPDFPKTAGTPAEVWAYSSRALTEKTGFEISGTKTKLDDLNDMAQADVLLDATPFAGADVAAVKARADAVPAFEVPVEDSIVMDGTELKLVEKDDDKMGLLEGYIDLTPMEAGDTIVIRQFIRVKTGGEYVQYNEETYSDAQSSPLLHVVTKAAKTAIKVTAEQTAGTNRTLDVQFFRRKES
jgi:hypothetical protein